MRMIDPYTLKVGDKVRAPGAAQFVDFRGFVYAIAAGCAVIKWEHAERFDPLLLTSQLWRFVEKDE